MQKIPSALRVHVAILVACVHGVLLNVCACAQPQCDSLWMQTYRIIGHVIHGGSVHSLPDGGFAILGMEQPSASAPYDMYLVRTDSSGNLIWQRTQTNGPFYEEEGRALDLTADGGFILAGNEIESFGGTPRCYMIKLDENGDTLWCRSFPGSTYAQFYSVLTASNGDYIAAGRSRSGSGRDSLFAVRVEPSGAVVWQHTLHVQGGVYGIAEALDHGFVLAGYGRPDNSSNDASSVTRIDSAGTLVWTHQYSNSTCAAIVCKPSGSYVTTGRVLPSFQPNPGWIPYLANVSDAGDTLWVRWDTTGLWDNAEGRGLCSTADGGFLVVGYRNGPPPPTVQNQVTYADSMGNPLWRWRFGIPGPHYEEVYVQPATNGGYVVGGNTVANDGLNDLFLLRLSAMHDSSFNRPPSITSYTPHTLVDTVDQNSTVHFGVVAMDPDGDSVLFVWTRDGMEFGTNPIADIQFSDTGTVLVECEVSDGHLNDSLVWHIVVRTAEIAEAPLVGVPTSYALRDAYPNPFNPSTIIAFDIPRICRMTLRVYDLLGRESATLVDGIVPAGHHTVRFDASRLTAGVYICRLNTNEFSSGRKLVLLK